MLRWWRVCLQGGEVCLEGGGVCLDAGGCAQIVYCLFAPVCTGVHTLFTPSYL